MALPVAFLLVAGMGLGSALPSTTRLRRHLPVRRRQCVLTPFGFTRTDAIAYILLVQALSYLMTGSWGALGFWQHRKLTP